MILLSRLRPTRVTCLATAAAGGLALCLLAGCGSGGPAASSTASGNSRSRAPAAAIDSTSPGADHESVSPARDMEATKVADATPAAVSVSAEEPLARETGDSGRTPPAAIPAANPTGLDRSLASASGGTESESASESAGTVDRPVRPSATSGLPENTLRSSRAAAGRPAETAANPSADAGRPSLRPAPSRNGNPRQPGDETLFADWPQPEFVLFVTGRQHGYIEPCGCTGLTNQKGGLVRRYTFKKQLDERGWTVVPIDVGNQVRRFGRQPEIKFQMTVEGMQRMGYRAIGFGPDDLRLSVGELVALTASDGQTPSPFVCANAAVIDPALTPRYQIVEAAGRKIGITAVLGDDKQAEITSDEIVKSEAVEALRKVWSELQQQGCDLYVLLAHTSLENSTALAQQFPKFDVVVTAGGAGEPTYEAEQIPETDAVMVQVGTKGMYVGIVGVFDDPRQPLRYQRVPLDARFPDSREMLQLLASYQDQLKTAGLEGLGIRPIPMPGPRHFVGSDACTDCHGDEYDIWEDTPHAHALDSLIHPGERSEVPRHFDPECISCHVVGWNPQKYFPYESGYLGLEKTPLMQHVGCENCHGPGSQHVAAEQGDIDVNDDQRLILQKEMVLSLSEAERKCMECHDLDNSPDFHVEGAFEEYWEQVAH